MDDHRVGTYTKLPFSPAREVWIDTVRIGMARNHIPVLVEAASGHKRVHALRLGRHTLILFDDVDVAVAVQRRLEGTEPPEVPPIPYVIRKANEKTLEASHLEIRAAQARALPPGEQTVGPEERMPSPRAIRIFASMPFVVRKPTSGGRTDRPPITDDN